MRSSHTLLSRQPGPYKKESLQECGNLRARLMSFAEPLEIEICFSRAERLWRRKKEAQKIVATGHGGKHKEKLWEAAYENAAVWMACPSTRCWNLLVHRSQASRALQAQLVSLCSCATFNESEEPERPSVAYCNFGSIHLKPRMSENTDGSSRRFRVRRVCMNSAALLEESRTNYRN